MPISFNDIPANWRQPLYWVEIDGSKAGFPRSHMRSLIVGTMITSHTGPDVPLNGVAMPDIPVIVGRQMDADHYFGKGSELANSMKAYFRNNFANETWAVGLAEPPGGSRASGTITVSTPPNEAGTINLYIAGVNVRTNIGATNTAVEIATAITANINSKADLPVTADNGGATPTAIITLKAKWAGITGNDITMRDSYFGRIGGEILPPGLVLTYSGFTLAGGVGTPDVDNLIANLGETEYEFVSLPWTDSTTLLAFEGEWDFSDSGRWGWMRQLYGHLFAAKRGSYSDLIDFGLTRNGKILSVMGYEMTALSPVYEWCAAYTAKAARALINDPARPLQTLHLEGILPAPFHDRFNLGELNALSNTGIATQRTLSDNVPMIARETTTYQLNLYGYGDDAFELVTTLATLAKLIRNQRYAITTKFPRHKLADDGTRFGAGQAIVTPKIVKAELVAQYRDDEFVGLVENADAFKANLIVERDPNDPNRLNVLYPPDLVNQLRIFAVLNQFRLQYNRGIDAEIIGDPTAITIGGVGTGGNL